MMSQPRFLFQFKELALGALNFPPEILANIQTLPQLSMIQVNIDKLSLVDPGGLRKLLDQSRASLFILNAEWSDRFILGWAFHNYSALLSMVEDVRRVNNPSFHAIAISLPITSPPERASVLLSYLGFLIANLGLQHQLLKELRNRAGTNSPLDTLDDWANSYFPDGHGMGGCNPAHLVKRTYNELHNEIGDLPVDIKKWIMHFALPCLSLESKSADEARAKRSYRLEDAVMTPGKPPKVWVRRVSIVRKITNHIFEFSLQLHPAEWAIWKRRRDAPGLFPGDLLSFSLEGAGLQLQGIVSHMDTHRLASGPVRADVRRINIIACYFFPTNISDQDLEADLVVGTDDPSASDPWLLKEKSKDDIFFPPILERYFARNNNMYLDNVVLVPGRAPPSIYRTLAAMPPWQALLMYGKASNGKQLVAAHVHSDNSAMGSRLAGIIDNFYCCKDAHEQYDDILGARLVSALLIAMYDVSGSFMAMLVHSAVHLISGSKVAYIQGFPGAGKTYLMCLFACVTVILNDMQILWTADTNMPLDAAERELAFLLGEAPVQTQHKFRRMPAGKQKGGGPLSVAIADRSHVVNSVGCILITSSSVAMDAARGYPILSKVRKHDIHVVDEAQGFGRPDSAIALHNLATTGMIIR